MNDPQGDPVPVSSADGLGQTFIVGYPRSGTTWVMWLLAQHPRVAAFQQSGFFHALKPIADWWETDHLFSRRQEAASDGAVYKMFGSTSVLDPKDFYSLCRTLAQHAFHQIATGTPGAKMVVEQTPENSEFKDLVLGIFPDAHFIHVIRDPRAAYCSIRSANMTWNRQFPEHPYTLAKRWKEIVRSALQIKSQTERYIEVRYEDLSRDPVSELQRIHASLGLESDRAACERAVEACRIDKLRSNTKMPKGFYRKGSVDGWRGEIPRRDLHILEYLLGEDMEKLGYAREHPDSRRRPFHLLPLGSAARIRSRLRRMGAKSRWPRQFKATGDA